MKRSGHARLKTALVLRDALAAELGVDYMRSLMAPAIGAESFVLFHDFL